MANKVENELQYAALISGVIGSMFEEDSDFHISEKELNEGDNMTHFIHALANITPTHLYNMITDSNKNHLQFNHIANQLCFQYSTYKDSTVEALEALEAPEDPEDTLS